MYVDKKRKSRVVFFKNGFTLIELLLVMMIVGVLMAVGYVLIGGQREKARLTAAMQTARSILPIAQECVFRKGAIDPPNNSTEPTNDVCVGSSAQWPKIEIEGCIYLDAFPQDEFVISCGSTGNVVCGLSSSSSTCKTNN